MVLDQVADWPAPTTAVIGSSLGGFYATAVAERLGCRAVMLNPAVDPARDLADHIGELTAWHSDDRFFFRPEFIAELRHIAPASLTHLQRYFAVIAKGDEVLRWNEMTHRYRGVRIKLLEGGDHALSDFETTHLPDVMAFLGLTGGVAPRGPNGYVSPVDDGPDDPAPDLDVEPKQQRHIRTAPQRAGSFEPGVVVEGHEKHEAQHRAAD